MNRARLERVGIWSLYGFVAALQLSIAAAQILLARGAPVLARHARHAAGRGSRRRRSSGRSLVYAVLTLVAAVFSVDPWASLFDCKQLLLFLMVPVVYKFARGGRARTACDVLITVGAASAAYGIIQYGILHYDNLGQRPQGAMGHYMTYSGLLMMVTTAALARVLFDTRDRAWPALVLPALLVALVLTFTRSAWVGACVAVAALLLLKDFRLVGALPFVVAIVLRRWRRRR